ncbi:hypothetical protein [Dactylosporangium sp. NPDC005555]|uniref:hypothetical protein n=1 Tax=Dactylosporangium sp. NPDC005555 TaxID=3154889 RepID=UPI0033A0F603
MPPVVLRRAGALRRSHRATLLALTFLLFMVAYSVLQVVIHSGDHDVPAVLDTLAFGLRWGWTVLAVLFAALALTLVALELSWLTGTTELTDHGIVLRSGPHSATVGWIDVEELRAVPAAGGHLFHLRTTVPMPRPPRLGLQGSREAWLGWHAGGDAAVAAVARPHLGVKYRSSPRA